MTLSWRVAAFDDLSLRELHDLLQLRARVFVVEQDCAYQDVDGRDPACVHLLAHHDRELVAHARLVPPATPTAHPAIGRVVVAPEARGRGVARELMHRAITETERRWPGPIHLSAQTYLLPFYRSLGFVDVGPGYLEDGIPHQGMERPGGAARHGGSAG